MKRLPIRNSGQALLVILLIMAVALTIGLAVTSRTVTDVEISGKTEEAARAFSAAEAGIEEALVSAIVGPFGDELSEGVGYTGLKTNLGEGNEYLFPKESASSGDDIRTLWLANYNDLSKKYDYDRVQIFWGNPGASPEPALEVIIYYGNVSSNNYRVIRYALDNTTRDPDNYFCRRGDLGTPRCNGVIDFQQGASILGQTILYSTTLDLSPALVPGNALLFARLRFLYNNDVQVLGVAKAGSGLTGFPSQGVKIESTGTAGTSNRKVEVIRMHPAPPGIFDFLLYSSGDLSK